jgi:hypothetical protein
MRRGGGTWESQTEVVDRKHKGVGTAKKVLLHPTLKT